VAGNIPKLEDATVMPCWRGWAMLRKSLRFSMLGNWEAQCSMDRRCSLDLLIYVGDVVCLSTCQSGYVLVLIDDVL
jgi:hypothetical protein